MTAWLHVRVRCRRLCTGNLQAAKLPLVVVWQPTPGHCHGAHHLSQALYVNPSKVMEVVVLSSLEGPADGTDVGQRCRVSPFNPVRGASIVR